MNSKIIDPDQFGVSGYLPDSVWSLVIAKPERNPLEYLRSIDELLRSIYNAYRTLTIFVFRVEDYWGLSMKLSKVVS